jgi:hypothetical protein
MASEISVLKATATQVRHTNQSALNKVLDGKCAPPFIEMLPVQVQCAPL